MKHAWIIVALLLAGPAFAGETTTSPDAGIYMIATPKHDRMPPEAEKHALVIVMRGHDASENTLTVIADDGFSMCGPLVFRGGKDFDVLRLPAGECLPASKTPAAGEKK